MEDTEVLRESLSSPLEECAGPSIGDNLEIQARNSAF